MEELEHTCPQLVTVGSVCVEERGASLSPCCYETDPLSVCAFGDVLNAE